MIQQILLWGFLTVLFGAGWLTIRLWRDQALPLWLFGMMLGAAMGSLILMGILAWGA